MATRRTSRYGRSTARRSYTRRPARRTTARRSTGRSRRSSSGGRGRSQTLRLVIQTAAQDANTSAFGQQVPTATGRARF